MKLLLTLASLLSSNETTLHSYELGVNQYIAGTPSELSGSIKTWIDATLQLLPKDAHILEIGSAFGRDAKYIESLGYTVERTDAAQGFVDLLTKQGYPARKFNILTDEFTDTYDLVFANAVFLHFTPEELRNVLSKIKNHARILSFSLKKGTGEKWTNEKLGQPRYFCYWTSDIILPLLTGYKIISITEDQQFLQIIVSHPDRSRSPLPSHS